MKNFKLILRSLISNHAVVQGARTKKWFFAIIMVFLSMILALIPTFVQSWTKEGDSIVSSNTYEIDVASERFLESIRDNDIVMTVENGQLIVDEEKWNNTYTTTDASGNKCYIHMHGETPDLGVYYVPYVKLTDDLYKTITSFPSTDADGNPTTVTRNYSFILFTEKTVTIYIYAVGKPGGQSIGTIYGDYQNLPTGWTINSILAEDSATTWTNCTSCWCSSAG